MTILLPKAESSNYYKQIGLNNEISLTDLNKTDPKSVIKLKNKTPVCAIQFGFLFFFYSLAGFRFNLVICVFLGLGLERGDPVLRVEFQGKSNWTTFWTASGGPNLYSL